MNASTCSACAIPSPNVDRMAFVVQAISIMHAINIVSYMKTARFCRRCEDHRNFRSAPIGPFVGLFRYWFFD